MYCSSWLRFGSFCRFKKWLHLMFSFWIFGLQLIIIYLYKTRIFIWSIIMSLFLFFLLVSLPPFSRHWQKTGNSYLRNRAHCLVYLPCPQFQWGNVERLKWTLYMEWVCITTEETQGTKNLLPHGEILSL